MISFKFPHLRAEFEGRRAVEGYKVQPGLLKLLFFLEGYCQYHFGKSIVVTELLRDGAAQDRLYKRLPEYAKKPWKSVHQFGCGADIRTSNFTQSEIDEIADIINRWFDYDQEGSHPSAIAHDIGRGKHLHLQVKPS